MSIFDQLGKIVIPTGGQAAAGGNGMAYLECLEQSRAEADQRLSGLFAELGKAYYERHKGDTETEYEPHLKTVRDTCAEIARYEQQAQEIAEQRRCSSCGAQLVEGSKFCNFCGIKLVEIQLEPPVQQRCPKCQTVFRPDNLFCTSCGADLRGGQVPAG